MALGKGIPVINGFDLNSKLPLDSRTVADTMENMNKLVTDGSVGDGQLCYCKADKKLYVLKEGVWSEVGGGGGKSVPPTLALYNAGTKEVRTTITEEEYNNLKNGLYNQVIYATEDNFQLVFSPSKLFSMDGAYGFTQFKIFANADETVSYSSMVTNLITIGEKNTSNEYPITVTNVSTINPPSGSGGGGGIPIVEGTKIEEESTENTKYYTIPEAQSSAFIFHSSDIGYLFVNVDVPDDLYAGILPTPYGQWFLIYGNGTSITVSTYTPASLYSISVNGSFPRDETSSVDVTFPLMDRFTNSMCLVSDVDVSMVFLKNGVDMLGSFQTPIIYCNDGKYRCWYMNPKQGDTATITCKVINIGGSGGSGNISVTFED